MTQTEQPTRHSQRKYRKAKGRRVPTIAFGSLWVYPVSALLVRKLEGRHGADLASVPDEALFEGYLGQAVAHHASAEVAARGLAEHERRQLTQVDRDALAKAATNYLGGSVVSDDSVHSLAQLIRKEATRIQAQRRIADNRVASLLGEDSAALAIFNESQRHSDLIRRALGPLEVMPTMKAAMDVVARARGPYADLLRAIDEAKAPRTPDYTPSIDSPASELLREFDVGDVPPAKDAATREHQDRLEAAGQEVIDLARMATLRINELADFAETFQIESAQSGRRNLNIALIALVVSAALSIVQLGYQVWKDAGDGSKEAEKMALMRHSNAAMADEITLLRQLVSDARREHTASPPSQAVPVAPNAQSSPTEPARHR